MNKPKNKKDLDKFLKSKNFSILHTNGKHEKWSDGNKTIIIPKKHKQFHVIGNWEILKKAGLV